MCSSSDQLIGPSYIKNAGGRITYDEHELERWRETQVVERVNHRHIRAIA